MGIGLTCSQCRVEVIKARVRRDGGDLDEHVAEVCVLASSTLVVLQVLREWQEQEGRAASVQALVIALRSQGFNDTAERLEDGSYLNKRGRR